MTSKIDSSCATLRLRVFTQLFALADVVAGEQQSAPARSLDERRERRLDRADGRRDAGRERAR